MLFMLKLIYSVFKIFARMFLMNFLILFHIFPLTFVWFLPPRFFYQDTAIYIVMVYNILGGVFINVCNFSWITDSSTIFIASYQNVFINETVVVITRWTIASRNMAFGFFWKFSDENFLQPMGSQRWAIKRWHIFINLVN